MQDSTQNYYLQNLTYYVHINGIFININANTSGKII